jgi:hypothetical protein
VFEFERYDVIGKVEIAHGADKGHNGTNAAVFCQERCIFSTQIEVLSLHGDR